MFKAQRVKCISLFLCDINAFYCLTTIKKNEIIFITRSDHKIYENNCEMKVNIFIYLFIKQSLVVHRQHRFCQSYNGVSEHLKLQ
jgi:hypothetical protein